METLIEIVGDGLIRKGLFKVRLASCGNPDHGQTPGRSMPGVRAKTMKVETIANASAACSTYIAEHELGAGNWSGGQVTENGKAIAKISYNGRVWQLSKS